MANRGIDTYVLGNIVVVINNNNSLQETFRFRDNPQALQFDLHMTQIREHAARNGGLQEDDVLPWLRRVRANAVAWGGQIPCDIRDATNQTEDEWAKLGHHIPQPIFRNSVPKLVNAVVEHWHCNRFTSFLHVYKARNNDMQYGYGVPNTYFVAHRRNRLAFVEVTYKQLDGTQYTVRTHSLEAGRFFRTWVIHVWDLLSVALQMTNPQLQDQAYRHILTRLTQDLQQYRPSLFPDSIRTAFHELQDRFGVPRTVFPPPAGYQDPFGPNLPLRRRNSF